MEINPQTLMEALKYIGIGLGGAGTIFGVGKLKARRAANGNNNGIPKEVRKEFQRVYDHNVPLLLCDERHGNLEKKVDHLTTKVDNLPDKLVEALNNNGKSK